MHGLLTLMFQWCSCNMENRLGPSVHFKLLSNFNPRSYFEPQNVWQRCCLTQPLHTEFIFYPTISPWIFYLTIWPFIWTKLSRDFIKSCLTYDRNRWPFIRVSHIRLEGSRINIFVRCFRLTRSCHIVVGGPHVFIGCACVHCIRILF